MSINEPLPHTHTDCWVRDHSNRPSFIDIQVNLKEVEGESFFSATSHEEFRSIQSSWKEEIQRNFLELKKIETVSTETHRLVSVTFMVVGMHSIGAYILTYYIVS